LKKEEPAGNDAWSGEKIRPLFEFNVNTNDSIIQNVGEHYRARKKEGAPTQTSLMHGDFPLFLRL